MEELRHIFCEASQKAHDVKKRLIDVDTKSGRRIDVDTTLFKGVYLLGYVQIIDRRQLDKHFDCTVCRQQHNKGAQWLSGRVLDSRPKGSGLEPHRRHCVVVLEQDTFILA